MKILSTLIIAFLLSSCATEWKNPSTSLPASELSIATLLLTPAIYQFEEVKTKGKVWDLLYLSDGEYELRFKLADEDGYYIEVLSDSELQVGEGDIIEVEGQFFRKYFKEKYKFETYIIAKKVALVDNTNIFKRNK